jgi:hypothetical protein
MARALAVAVFASNWGAWEGIPVLEKVTSYRVSTAVLCAVTVAIALVGLVVCSHPRWPWLVVIAGSAVQAVQAAVPTSEVGGNWGYIPVIAAMAGSALVSLVAIGAFVATFTRHPAPHGR